MCLFQVYTVDRGWVGKNCTLDRPVTTGYYGKNWGPYFIRNAEIMFLQRLSVAIKLWKYILTYFSCSGCNDICGCWHCQIRKVQGKLNKFPNWKYTCIVCERAWKCTWQEMCVFSSGCITHGILDCFHYQNNLTNNSSISISYSLLTVWDISPWNWEESSALCMLTCLQAILIQTHSLRAERQWPHQVDNDCESTFTEIIIL